MSGSVAEGVGVGLIVTDRHSRADLDHWRRLERMDHVIARGQRLTRLEARAIGALRAWLPSRLDNCYLGVSWGKDSVVTADLTLQVCAEMAAQIPVVWIVARPVCNPHCCAVRDAFLAAWPDADYYEILDDRHWAPDAADARWTGWAGDWRTGFDVARQRFGRNHISGVRAEESKVRRRRMQTWGEASPHTLAPIGHWRGQDVFAYLAKRDLPVHPAYAYAYGGNLDRIRIRVDALGGETGTARGRREWESHYYGPEIDVLCHSLRRPEDVPWWQHYPW
jgi:phosphoadenosine phosphosulfate reductase